MEKDIQDQLANMLLNRARKYGDAPEDVLSDTFAAFILGWYESEGVSSATVIDKLGPLMARNTGSNLILPSPNEIRSPDEVDQAEGASPFIRVNWRAPREVWVEGDQLIYGPRTRRVQFGRLRPGEPLKSFAALASLPDEGMATAIESFAGRYGVLGICSAHGLPSSHSQGSFGGCGIKALPMADYCSPKQVPHSKATELTNNSETWVEPLSAWKEWAELVSATLQLSRALHSSKHGDICDWQVWDYRPEYHEGLAYHGSSSDDRTDSKHPSYRLGKYKVADYVNVLLDRAGVRPWMHWEGQESDFRLVGQYSDSLLTVVTVQLMLAVCKKEGFASCSRPGCHNVVLLKRGQGGTRRVFCDKCRQEDAAHFLNQKDYIERNRVDPNRQRRPKVKLSERDRDRIISEKGKKSAKELAAYYGVSQARIYQIQGSRD